MDFRKLHRLQILRQGTIITLSSIPASSSSFLFSCPLLLSSSSVRKYGEGSNFCCEQLHIGDGASVTANLTKFCLLLIVSSILSTTTIFGSRLEERGFPL